MNQGTTILTRDELLAFLAIMGSTTMNGLEEEPLAGLDEQEIAERLNSGEQSLIKRGLLVINDDAVTLDDTLVALVGSSVVPDATLLLNRLNPDRSNESHYFNATAELLVEHYSLSPGVYIFDYLPSAAALRDRFLALVAPLSGLDSGEIGSSFSDLRLTGDSLAQVVSDCRQDEVELAKQHLREAGWPDPAAEQFAHDCVTYATWLTLVAWHLRNGDTAQGGGPVMIVQGEKGCWLFQNEEGDADHVYVRTATGSQGIEAMTALLEPLLQTLTPA